MDIMDDSENEGRVIRSFQVRITDITGNPEHEDQVVYTFQRE